ncbi:DUF6443 domain-containing protein [Flavobacterium sp. PS2]|uniref:DUF6443 domain-containing protein n=1 Tax=Flavobacterium sp. PS2 TaxID=3384157 RepID=UPI00390C8608
MKKYLSLIILLLFSNATVVAQAFSDDNFIYTASPKKGVTADYFKTLKKEEMNQSVTYFDGLGRPIQTIAIGQGGNGEDIITPIEYDGFGRQEKEYLSFSLPNGNNKYPKKDRQTAINATKVLYGTEKYDYTANPFSEKKFENSPLNRVLKQAAPGNDWAMGSGHEIKLDYQTNTTNEVRLLEAATIWNATAGLYDITFWDNKYYDKNELYKTITYDENSSANLSETKGSTVEFKDKEGRLILKRTYESDKKHDTYYVYDEYGNLTYVIPPKADGAISDKILNNLCYQYKYDNRNRLVEKKLPGKQWEFIVYDRLNRVVATGPANSPFQDDTTVGWLLTKYDVFGRSIYTGWDNTVCNSGTRQTWQKTQNAVIPVIETQKKTGMIEGIKVETSSIPSASSFKLLTATYYDTYHFPNLAPKPSAIYGQSVLSMETRLVTGGWTRITTSKSIVLGETNSLFYDTNRKPIESYIINYLGGYTYVQDRLDFTGKKITSLTAHKRMISDSGVSTLENFTYSIQDRLLTHFHRIGFAAEELLANNTYDALGQLINKNVGNSASSPFQKIDYKYNIRGWLTGINNTDNLQYGNDPKDLFAFKINYNKVEGNATATKALYNGNIAETFWAAGSDGIGIIRGYGYQYDHLNRLKNATYQTPKLTDNKNYFGENMDYDKNGNITRLQRKFMAGTLSNPYVDDMDNLGYFYPENSNQLVKVTDTSNNPQGFKDDSNGYNDTEDDYAYDDSGNLIKDQNKNITKIQYNHLNLPTKITFGTGNTIAYIYNATGQKLEKNVTENGVVTNTKYLAGGFQYKNDVLQFFPTAEGYVRNTSTNATTYVFGYVYNYTDHLGNVRLSYAQNPLTKKVEILEENNYYPFGLKHQGYNTLNNQLGYKYKYNSRELQDELGLNMTAMDYRQYDPAIGRFNSMDRLSELAYSISPYRFAYNNPVYWNDPTGLFESIDEAKKWAKEHGIRTGWFSRNKIEEVGDGTWAINNKKEGTSHSAVNATDAEAMGLNAGDVVTSVLFVGESKKKESDPLDFSIWGTDRSGDTSGRKGSASHSLNSTDFVTPGNSRSLNNKTTGIWEWIMSLVYNSSYTGQHAKAIQDNVKKSGNTSTMEVQNLNPELPPEIITVLLDTTHYHIKSDEKVIEKRTGKKLFKGTRGSIQSSKDSINEKNKYYDNWFNN